MTEVSDTATSRDQDDVRSQESPWGRRKNLNIELLQTTREEKSPKGRQGLTVSKAVKT